MRPHASVLAPRGQTPIASRAMPSPSVLVFFILLFFSLFAAGAPDLASDRAALLAFRTAVGRTLGWNVSAPSPCNWRGVTCAGGRVVQLRLPASFLAGSVPAGTLGNLTELTALSLRFNRLSGTLPADLSALSKLQGLFLNENAFSGPIPTSVFSLAALVKLTLDHNNFSGGISPAFNNLTGLRTLFLEKNQLSGEIPSDLNLPNLVEFNVSYNKLNGSIPAKLRTKPRNAFIGNDLCGGPLGLCPGEISPAPTPNSTKNGTSDGSSGSKKLSAGAIAGIAIGASVGLLILLLLLLLCCRRSSRGEGSAAAAAAAPKSREVNMATRDKGVAENGSGPSAAPSAAAPSMGSGGSTSGKKLVFVGNVQRVYDLEDLLRASAEVLGKGTTGTTYKAMLEMKVTVVVKRLRDMNLMEKEFRDKVMAIANIEHPNLVTVQAYYYSKEEKLIVFDYVPNGSLSSLLHGNRGSGRTPLDWETRLAIALGAARGIQYIHSKGSTVSHGNIKSSNILLNKQYEPLVSDNGLCSLGSSVTPNRAIGYRAPEVTDVRRVTQKADVYSFGILILELLTGKIPSQAVVNEDGIDLPRWVQSVVREEWTSEVFDMELLRYQNVEEEMVQLLQFAMDCVVEYPDNRPSMTDVVAHIEDIQRSSMKKQQQRLDHADDRSSQNTNSANSRPASNDF